MTTAGPRGPVWLRDGGYLLFSDVVKNTIYRLDGIPGEL
jgi:sugar lactone lactonase YvrE